MKMKTFVRVPSNDPFTSREINKGLSGAVHVETYTRDEGGYGGAQTLTIFAFYPDEPIATKESPRKHINTITMLRDFMGWLQEHELDIADGLNDFGDLRIVFKKLCGREAIREL